MSEAISIEGKTLTEITPEIAARAFARMDSIQQAEFFEHLAAETQSWGDEGGLSATLVRAYPYGEMQWAYMKDEIRKRPEAEKAYMALSAFAFDYWPQKSSL